MVCTLNSLSYGRDVIHPSKHNTLNKCIVFVFEQVYLYLNIFKFTYLYLYLIFFRTSYLYLYLYLTLCIWPHPWLGPLFFFELETNLYLFADDTFMLDIFSDPARINRDLERIHACGVLWNVLFNPVKTNYMIATNRFIAYPTLYFNNIPVDYTNLQSQLTYQQMCNKSLSQSILSTKLS